MPPGNSGPIVGPILAPGGCGATVRAEYPLSMDRIRQDTRRFDRDETADILDLAGELEARMPGDDFDLGRSDIYRIAAELGISMEIVDRAIRELDRTQRSEAKASRRSVRRRMRFLRHALAYAITVAILAAVDVLDGGGWWFYYVAAIWGIALALHALRFATRRNGPLERRLTEA